MNKLIYPLFLFLLVLIGACKKNNEVFPQIEILEPQQGLAYHFEDSIIIEVRVSQLTENPSVRLVDGAQILDHATLLSQPSNGIWVYYLYLNKSHLPTGNYEISAVAVNGTNTKSDFVTINYTELPLKLNGLLTLEGNQSLTKVKYHEDGISSIKSQLNYKARLFDCSSEIQQFVTASVYEGNLTGYSILNGQQEYSLGNPGIVGVRQYEFVYSYDNNFYGLQSDGTILEINEQGAISRSFSLDNNAVPYCIDRNVGELFVATRSPNQSYDELLIMSSETGFVLKRTSVIGSVVALASTNNRKAYLLYENSNQLVFAVYNYDVNTLTTISSYSNEQGKDLIVLPNNSVLIASNTAVRLYDPLIATLPVVNQNFGASDLDFNPLNNEVYYATGNKVLKGRLGNVTSQLLQLEDSVFNVELVFNK